MVIVTSPVLMKLEDAIKSVRHNLQVPSGWRGTVITKGTGPWSCGLAFGIHSAYAQRKEMQPRTSVRGVLIKREDADAVCGGRTGRRDVGSTTTYT
jgi:hypothetical protein